MINILSRFKKPVEPSAKTSKSVPENWHEEFIELLAAVIRPKVYVELGLYECVVFNKLIPYAEKLIGLDMKPEAEKFIKHVPGKTEFVCSTTDDFAERLKKNPIQIDMLFIDADHAKEAVLKDFYSFFPFVAPHGLILLHDSHPRNIQFTDPRYCNDAYKAIEELGKNTTEYEIMTIPKHPGLTLCRKRITQLSW